MENLLLKYMNERIGKAPLMSPPQPGPVITISRQCGCNANDVAEVLIEKINATYGNNKNFVSWKHVSKEILALASEELKMHPEQVEIEAQSGTFIIRGTAAPYAIETGIPDKSQ